MVSGGTSVRCVSRVDGEHGGKTGAYRIILEKRRRELGRILPNVGGLGRKGFELERNIKVGHGGGCGIDRGRGRLIERHGKGRLDIGVMLVL